MSKPVEDQNKALVLEAFDTLFNQRDYVAAERYWSRVPQKVLTLKNMNE